jgi:hypothetical protein
MSKNVTVFSRRTGKAVRELKFRNYAEFQKFAYAWALAGKDKYYNWKEKKLRKVM